MNGNRLDLREVEQKKEFPDLTAIVAEALSQSANLPALCTHLEAEISDPYQMMAVYQRQRHASQEYERWPDRSASEPVVSRYPNILAELDASGWWIDRIAGDAHVSIAIMAAVIEDSGELNWEELRGLANCFKCRLDYLTAPVLSMVDPTTNKGKRQLQRLKELVQQTEGMDRYFYHRHSSDVLPKMEDGKPVTYAAYRWACNRLQDVLDRKAKVEAEQRRTRTEPLSKADSSASGTSLQDRLWQAKRRYIARVEQERRQSDSQMAQARLREIQVYVDRARPIVSNRFCSTTKDLLALAELSKQDLYGALALAIVYGQAMGHQAAVK